MSRKAVESSHFALEEALAYLAPTALEPRDKPLSTETDVAGSANCLDFSYEFALSATCRLNR